MKTYQWGAMVVAVVTVVWMGCSDDDNNPVHVHDEPAQVTVNLDNVVSGVPVVLNAQNREDFYSNAAGEPYNIRTLQYVISDVVLHGADGGVHGMDGIHYRDEADPSTRGFTMSVPAGRYDMVSFTFGLDETKNLPGAYPELDAVNMKWPDPMGGCHTGYHYMKLEGDFIMSNDAIGSYLTHTGARYFDTACGSSSTDPHAYHHYFRVSVPIASTEMEGDSKHTITIDMDVNGWYEDPILYSFESLVPPMIMGNLTKQNELRTNGPSCFSATVTATQ